MEITKVPPYSSSNKRAPQVFPSEAPESGGVFPYLHILRNRQGLIAGAVFISLLFAFFINWTQKPVYQAATELIIQSQSKNPSLGQTSVSFFQDPTLMSTQFRLIKSPQLAEQALKKLEKPENREGLLRLFAIHPSRKRNEGGVFSNKERQALLGAIPGSVAVRQPDRAVRILTISAEGYEPQMVARLADAVSEAYIEVNYTSHLDSFRQSVGMVSKSLAEIREKIKTGELASQKINSEIQLLEALKIYGERYPQVVKLRSEISEAARKLRLGVQNLQTMEISRHKDKDLVPLLMHPSLELEKLQKIEADLYTLKPTLDQELGTNREIYKSIFRRLQEIELLGGGSEWVDAKILERAGVPGQPIRPNKRLNLMVGFFFGLCFGVGLAFFLEYLDSSVRSIEDVTSYLKLFPLGMVPEVEYAEKKEKGEKDQQPIDAAGRNFWLAGDSGIPLFVAEAYRIIRTNLAFGSIDTALKTLLVTSAVKGEGKTTTAANLAVSLASSGSKILLVDADLRRPALHKILGLWPGTEKGGLADSLTNGKSWESVVVPTSTPNLFFIGSGSTPPNPAELLSSKRMKSLIEELKEHFDLILFDSPPVISVADSAIIASRVDGTILVSRSGFIPRHLCLQAKNALESIHARVIGCVLNGVQTQHQPYYYYEYYRQYGHYHEDAEEDSRSRKRIPSLGVPSETMERLKVLREPLLLFLSNSWARIVELLKWERLNKEETKSSVGRSSS